MKIAILEYCVYHTKYIGDKMPNNYVGSSSVHKVECGYKGSVKSKKWKKIWELVYQNISIKSII